MTTHSRRRTAILPTALATLLGVGGLLALTGCAAGDEASSRSDNAATAESTVDQPTGVTPLNVFAAASTRVFEKELSDGATQLPQPSKLTMNFDGSSGLVQQMEDGAPADVFLSADKRNMDKAVEKGLVRTPVKVAENSMVMVVPKGNPAHITGVDDSLRGAKLVLCDAQVPCGGVSAALEKDLGVELPVASYESKVSDVLGKVVSGEADAGWVYRTDAAAAGDKVEVIEIPGADKHINELWAAVSAQTPNAEAATVLLTYLSGPEFAETWSHYGFTPASQV